jgi:signal peptidase II
MKYRFLYLFFLAIFLLDRITKLAVLSSDNFIKNPGVAFGLGKSIPGILFFLIALGLIVLIYLAKQLDLNKFSNQLALGLIFGGGISNILDRSFYGYVIDFIDIFSIAAFNLADVGVIVGAIIILANFLNLPKMQERK